MNNKGTDQFYANAMHATNLVLICGATNKVFINP